MLKQVQNLRRRPGAHYIVPNLRCQAKIFLFDPNVKVLYNYYIHRRESMMTDTEFYRQIQEDWYHEFAGAELSEIFVCTNAHAENFEFDDVPF